MKNFLTWFPRITVIAFALFISLFAGDAFTEGGITWRQLGGFFLHLIPTAITLVLLWVAWKHRMVGGLLFVIWGLVFTINFATHRSTPLFLMFSLPLLASGFMFIFSQLYVGKRFESWLRL